MRNGQFSEPEIPAEIPAPSPATTQTRVSTSAPAPVRTQQKNLAEKAIDLVHAVKLGANCSYTERNGIYTILIKESGNLIGQLRISDNNHIKCDFFDNKHNVYFFGDIKEIQKLI